MVQVTCEIDFTNFSDIDMFWGPARDFIKNRTYDEMERLNEFFDECYSDSNLSLTELNDILAYDSDYLLENALGYLKDQTGEWVSSDLITDLNSEKITYDQFEKVIFNSSEVMEYISEKTKDYILNFKMDGIAAEDQFFTTWVEKIKEKTDPDSEIYSDLEELSNISFDSENWNFND